MRQGMILRWRRFALGIQGPLGKRGKSAAATFEFDIADRLLDLQAELDNGDYQPGAYQHFVIHEPKRRLISAAPFRDRVVHHALCNVIEPLFEVRFYKYSYANRKGKGTHRAIDQLQTFAHHYRYVLRLDIVQHFPSLDHTVLKHTLNQVVIDPHVQQLITVILGSGADKLAKINNSVSPTTDSLLSPSSFSHGLPIGNLTSQFWSNCYLNSLDWFIVRELGCSAYLRYVDDFALFANSKRTLWQWREKIISHLANLQLTLHENSAQVSQTSDGIPWLGFIVYPTHRKLKRRNVVHFHKRLKRNIDLYQQGNITFAELDSSVQGWINHVRYGDTWNLGDKVLGRI